MSANVILRKNKPIVLNVNTIKCKNKLFDNISISIDSKDVVPIEAISKPISKERIIEQINKTNDSIFYFDKIDVNLDDNLFLPSIKILNELRRTALDEVYNIAKSKIFRISPKIEELKSSSCEKKKISKSQRSISLLLNILDENTDYSSLKDVNEVYIPLKYFSGKKFEKAINSVSNSFDTFIYLPPVIKANYKNLLANVIDNSIDKFNIKGFVISNLSSITFMDNIKKKYNNKYKFIANYTLNVFNKQTIQELENFGVEKLTISPESDSSVIQSISKDGSIKQELIVYGRTPLMHMNYCLLGKTNKCYPTCGVHCKDSKVYLLKDRLRTLF